MILSFFLASCTKEVSRFSDRPVEFEAGASDAWTKADVNYFITGTGSNVPPGKKVGVFGWYTKEENWSDDKKANYFFNQPLVSNDSHGLDYPSGDNTKYWPSETTEKVSFYGYYPHDSYSGTGITVDPDGNGTADRIRFVTNPLAEKQIDFMVSELEKDMVRQAVSEKVQLKFHHALSQICIKGNKLKYIELKGIVTEGDCLPMEDAASRLADGTWPKWEERDTDNVSWTQGAGGSDDDKEMLFLVIPQDLRNTDAQIVITDGDDKTSVFNLKDFTDKIPEWKPGVKYTYSFVDGEIIVNVNTILSEFHLGDMAAHGAKELCLVDDRLAYAAVYDQIKKFMTENPGQMIYLAMYYEVGRVDGTGGWWYQVTYGPGKKDLLYYVKCDEYYPLGTQFYYCVPLASSVAGLQDILTWMEEYKKEDAKTGSGGWDPGSESDSNRYCFLNIHGDERVLATKIFLVTETYYNLSKSMFKEPLPGRNFEGGYPKD